jgi:hypothetical protein
MRRIFFGVAGAPPYIMHIMPQLCCDPAYPVNLLTVSLSCFSEIEWKVTC